jgi:nitrogen fixation protein NifU and related proteins
MNDMYRENLLDHAKNMRNKGLLDPNDFDHSENNPLCGDKLHLTLRIDEGGIIREVGWDGSGCAVSQASASMLGEQLIGMSLEDAKKLKKHFVLDLIGFPLTMNRVKCALLSLKTLLVGADGIERWEQVEDDD